MLIDTDITIAYKCSSCGSFEFNNISLFSFVNKEGCTFFCRCRKSCIVIKPENESDFYIKMPCIGCGNEHTYFLTRKDMLFKELNSLSCPETGLQQCFIGQEAEVGKRVDILEQEFDQLIDMFGYESYFKNTQVMIDSLNRIHDIAAKGNLACECGSNSIELVLLRDRILLKCSRCNSGKIVKASTNEDLKKLSEKNELLVCAENRAYNKKKIEK